MRIKELVIAGAVIVAAYKIGRMSGHIDCFKQFVDKYGDDILKGSDEIITKLGKKYTIIVTAKAK